MDNKKRAEMNFDTWSEMARDDPEAFESMRRAAIEAVIAQAPEANRERLRRLQWRIDQERRLAHSPSCGACSAARRPVPRRGVGWLLSAVVPTDRRRTCNFAGRVLNYAAFRAACAKNQLYQRPAVMRGTPE